MKAFVISIILCAGFINIVFGEEFQVNAYTSYDQKNAAISMNAEGGFVVVWSSYNQDGSSNGIFGRLFDPDCAPLGEEFQVNTEIEGNQTEASVAMNPGGDFLVTWHGPGTGEQDEEDIFARRFDSNGVPFGGEFRVNDVTVNAQLYPAAVGDNGNFIIVWESTDLIQEGERAICGRLYDCNGHAIGNEIIVTRQFSDCRYPDVAMNTNGDIIVVWMQDYSSNTVWARFYHSDGEPKTDEFVVSTVGFSSACRPSIAMDSTGYSIVTWDGDPKLARQDDIHGRFYDPDGAALGSQFVINTYCEGPQQNPHVSINDEGEFVVVWETRIDPEINDLEVFGRIFDSQGNPSGDDIMINSFTEGHQRYPAVAIGPDGRYVTVWQSDEQDGSGYGIFGCVQLP
jgi:hypothetical protein